MRHVAHQVKLLVGLAAMLFLALTIGAGGAAARASHPSRGGQAHHHRHRDRRDHRRRRHHRHHHHHRRHHRDRRHRHGGAGVPHSRLTGDVPEMQVNGTTLSWNAVDGDNQYVFVEKIPGQPDQYEDIQGTSIHPAVVPGKMVWFSVRANTSGSEWASEVAIDYPQSGATDQPAQGSESIGPLAFKVGLVAGEDLPTQLSYLTALGAGTARLEFDIDTPVSIVTQVCQQYARAGVRPLLLASFAGRLPSVAEAQALGTWAAAVGPGGSAWNGGQAPNGDAVTDIEFGNETNDTYQYADNSIPAYTYRARTYALRARTAALSIRAANPGVGLLAIGGTGYDGSQWISSMFDAVPNLGSLVAGWTVHPYGPDWATSIQSTISATRAAGAPAGVPIWITEWGLASDGGGCLAGGNYGFSGCLTYTQAASTLQSALSAMSARFGSRIAAVYLFQAADQQPIGASTSNQAYYGALQNNGSPKGLYTTAVEDDLGGQ